MSIHIFRFIEDHKFNELSSDFLTSGLIVPAMDGVNLFKISDAGSDQGGVIIDAKRGRVLERVATSEMKNNEHPMRLHRVLLGLDKRFFVDTARNQLITIPLSNDRLVVHKLSKFGTK